MMINYTLRTSAFAALAVGLAACSSGTAQAPRTASPTGQSGTMGTSGMGQMDHSRMGQMDHAQMMQHCREMMSQ